MAFPERLPRAKFLVQPGGSPLRSPSALAPEDLACGRRCSRPGAMAVTKVNRAKSPRSSYPMRQEPEGVSLAVCWAAVRGMEKSREGTGVWGWG